MVAISDQRETTKVAIERIRTLHKSISGQGYQRMVIKGCESLGKYISCPLNVLSASPLYPDFCLFIYLFLFLCSSGAAW